MDDVNEGRRLPRWWPAAGLGLVVVLVAVAIMMIASNGATHAILRLAAAPQGFVGGVPIVTPEPTPTSIPTPQPVEPSAMSGAATTAAAPRPTHTAAKEPATTPATVHQPATKPPTVEPYPKATIQVAEVQFFQGAALERRIAVTVDVAPTSTRSPRVTVTVHWRVNGVEDGQESKTFKGSGHFEAQLSHVFGVCSGDYVAQLIPDGNEVSGVLQYTNLKLIGQMCNIQTRPPAQ